MKTVTVQSLADYNYAMLVTDGRHAWVADEPAADGGDDLGPSLYELLLSALGSCVGITLLMYARRKQWPLYEVSVHLKHEKVSAADCPNCSEEDLRWAGPDGRIDLITKEISLRGDLDQQQVERLVEVADRCPVNRTLQRPAKIVTSVRAGN